MLSSDEYNRLSSIHASFGQAKFPINDNTKDNTKYSQSSLSKRMEQKASQQRIEPTPPTTSLGLKIDNLTKIVTRNDETLNRMVHDISAITNEISKIKDLEQENIALKEQCYATQGKVARLEMKNVEMKQKLLDMECREMSRNLMFYNVPEHQNETQMTLRDKIYQIILENMSVPRNLVFTPDNPSGEIRIDTIHRVGKFARGKERPIVVKFLTQFGRDQLMSKNHLDELRKSSRNKVRISEQFPPEIKERRSSQIEKLKALREEHKDTNMKITLIKDKISVNKTILPDTLFERSSLPSSSPISIHYNKMTHSNPLEENGSTFMAHKAQVSSKSEATAARNAIFQNPELAKSSHIIYAYKITSPLGQTESGFSDDGENNAGKLLLDMIDDRKISNVFLCITRLKQGPNIGKIRFELIRKAATEALDTESSFQDSKTNFNFLSF